MKAIILKLRGPLRSWGAMSIGDDRWTTNRPTASAAIGLLGACAGIDHHQPELVAQWYRSWSVISASALQWSVGHRHFTPSLRTDFQTARNSLKMDGSENEEAVVSRRGYLEEAREVCAIVFQDNADPALFDLAVKGLQFPVYTPFLGRRSNPLSQPMSDSNSILVNVDLNDLVDRTIVELSKSGLMEEEPVFVSEIELSANAGLLDAWRESKVDLDASVVRQSVADDRISGARTHSSRSVDVIRFQTGNLKKQETAGAA